jgi:hypothetical protein
MEAKNVVKDRQRRARDVLQDVSLSMSMCEHVNADQCPQQEMDELVRIRCPCELTCRLCFDEEEIEGLLRFPSHDWRKNHTPNAEHRWALVDLVWGVVSR